MKTISEYINIAAAEITKSVIGSNDKDAKPWQSEWELICQFALQLSKQNADLDLAEQRHKHNVEIEYLRSRLKHFTPASESSQKYLSMLQNTDEKKLIVANYVKRKNTTVPALNQSEVSELIDMLKAVKSVEDK